MKESLGYKSLISDKGGRVRRVRRGREMGEVNTTYLDKGSLLRQVLL